MCTETLSDRLKVFIYQAADLKNKRKMLEEEEDKVDGQTEVRHMRSERERYICWLCCI